MSLGRCSLPPCEGAASEGEAWIEPEEEEIELGQELWKTRGRELGGRATSGILAAVVLTTMANTQKKAVKIVASWGGLVWQGDFEGRHRGLWQIVQNKSFSKSSGLEAKFFENYCNCDTNFIKQSTDTTYFSGEFGIEIIDREKHF